MVTHQQVDAVNRFLHTTYGRERTCRLIQYFARFYAFYLTRQGASAATIQRWSDLKQHVGNARKFFRLLKPIEFAQSGVKALSTSDEILRATGVLKQLGMGLYYSAEVLVLTNAINFYQPKNIKSITDFGQRCWLLGITASFISGLYKLKLISVRNQMLVKERTFRDVEKDDTELKLREVAVQREKYATSYQLLQDALDFTIPSSALGLLPLDDGIVGIAG
ncbi:peroxisomal biogenesis factor 11 [Absidia repens]|uniref:Peroxisomal biogenesis factor 11 n=1 Tax=Absidia repens TaxID=90262 RepID=A0A1X2IXW5_9FUNG|nr:peroxisomal biogenesis factor 11 [Absidia repens]